MSSLFNIMKITVDARKLRARVLVNPGMPLMTSEDIEATARVYYLAPAIAKHVCLGDAGREFQDCMGNTELAHLLELNGYETRACDDFETAAHDIVDVNPDCVILDLGLPGADGQSICRDVRRQSDVPIIVLTAKNDEFTEVMSLNLGAHDFVAKPYRPAVLLARIASLVKRHATASAEASTITHGEVTLDLSVSEVRYRGRSAELTRNEQRILALLMRNAGTIISRQEIMCDLWESDAFVDDNTLTVNINRLRKTLASIGIADDFLQTRRSLGYVIMA